MAVHLIVEGARTKDRAFDYVLQLNGRRTALTHERWMRHPFQATQLSTRMLAEGLPMIEVRPTVLNFSESMKTLEALVLQKKLAHGVCELADEIMAARAQKPVVAIANSLAAVENGLCITGRSSASRPASLAPRTGMTSDLAASLPSTLNLLSEMSVVVTPASSSARLKSWCACHTPIDPTSPPGVR